MALPNLQRIVDFMLAEKATHHLSTVSIYGVAKHLGKQHKQATQLLRDRPGFVEVHRDGKFQGYYYDYEHFGSHYPANYRDLKRTKILLSEDLKDANAEAAKTIQAKFDKAVKDAGRPSEPDITLLSNIESRRQDLTVNFPYVDRMQALSELKRASAKFSEGTATDEDGEVIIACLLSLTVKETE